MKSTEEEERGETATEAAADGPSLGHGLLNERHLHLEGQQEDLLQQLRLITVTTQ